MKTHLTKRLIALVLTLVMVLSLVPMTFAEEPAADAYVLATELKDGDKVVIYHPGSGKAVSNADLSESQPKYRAGVAVTPEDGKLTDPDAALVWTVAETEDGITLADAEGKLLGVESRNLYLDAANTVWEIRASEIDGAVNLVNKNAPAGSESNDPQAIEWFNKYSEFTAYYLSPASADFALQLFVLQQGGDEPGPGEEPSDDIVVLYTNDVHCGVDQSDSSIGVAGLAKVKKELEATHKNVTLVDNGDFIQGELIGTVSKGEYLVDIMNYLGYDYAVFGNHEFDYNMTQLKKLVGMAHAQYLNCNFKYIGEGENPDAIDLPSYVIKDYDGLKVAFLGITTPESLVKSTPTYFMDEDGNWIYTFCNDKTGKELYDAVQDAVDAARAEGAEIVVALAHLGIDEESVPWRSTDVIANTTGIDVMLDGHSHSTIECQEVNNKDGKTVLLTSTGTKLANIGKLTITPEGSVSTELIHRADVDGVDEETQAYLESIEAEFEELKKTVVAHTDYDLLINHPETGKRQIRFRETNLGDICADAYRTALDADIAFVNGGGVRADIKAGDITFEQIIKVHPYSNKACKVKTTGQQILDALEMAARVAILDRDGNYKNENGGFLHVSGLKYTIDSNIKSGVKLDEAGMFAGVEGERRVKDVQVLQADGTYAPIDPEATYTLASHNYLLKQAGDGLNMFRNDEVLLDEVKVDNQVLIEYMTSEAFANHDYSNWEGEGRITFVPKFTFDDVSNPDKFYYTPVYWAYDFEPQITAGTDETHFSPKEKCTRGQVVTFLWRAMGEPEPDLSDNPFVDLKEGAFYFNAVLWAYQNGVTSGVDETHFGPKQTCTRGQVVTFLWNAMGNPEPKDRTNPFEDAFEGKYYYEAMLWAFHNDITAGTDETHFSPKDSCTRGQVVSFLYRTLTAEPEEIEFEFLVTSDLHGQIYATDYTKPYEQSGTYDRGLTRVATYIKEQREAFGENLYVVDMGDTFQGAPLTYYYAFNKPEEKDPAILAFRTIGYDMWLVGNHEFNYGLEILNRQMEYAVSEGDENEKQLTICLANYLDANTNSDEAKDWATWKGYAPYVIKDFGGFKVAIIGFGNPNIPKWDVPANWEGIYFADIIETYRHYEAEMLEQADMIAVVAHSGIGSDEGSDFMERLINATDSIAFAFSGHEHGNQVYEAENANGTMIPILQPYTKARAIAQVKVHVTRDNIRGNDETRYTAEIKNMQGYAVDEELAALLLPYETDTWENYMLQPIGQALGNYPAANLGTAPSAFMDLINTVQTWGAYDRTGENTPDKPEDDVPAMLSISAPLTSGSKENLIDEGNIYLGDMFGLYRFENWFYQITMSGEEVRQWLEFAATKIQTNDEDGSFYVTNGDLTFYDVIMGEGFHYEIDVSKDEGERVVKMTYNGEDVAPDQIFTVVVNNYRYNGGGNYIKWLNEHGCDFEPNDPDRIIYSTQFDMIQGEDEGQARALLVSYIKEQTAENGGITPFITSDWVVRNGEPEEPGEGYYELISEAPEDWTGSYLIVYSDGETNYVFNGNEEANGYVAAEITDGKIALAEGMEPVEIAAMEGGYSLHVTNGYMYGVSDKNMLKFSNEPSVTTIELDADGNAVITNNTTIFRFNNRSDQLRFRYYKSSSNTLPLVTLYKYVEG